MKILDRYILKSFFVDFLICLFTLMSVCIILQTFEKASEFAEYFEGVERDATSDEEGTQPAPQERPSPFVAIGRYYLLHLPILYGQGAPIILLMAAMFTVTRMARAREFVPIKASGVSLYRALAPILVASLVLSGLNLVVQELLVPRLGDSIRDSEMISELGDPILPAVQRIDHEGNVYYFSRFGTFHHETLGLRVVMRYPPSLGGRKQSVIQAEHARFERVDGRYELVLSDGVIERFDPESGFRLVGYPQRFGVSGVRIQGGLTPMDVLRSRSHETLVLRSLAELRREVEENPSLAEARVALYSRYAQPIAGIVLLFLGLPFVLGREAQNFLLGTGIAVTVSAAFYGISLVGLNLGRKGMLPPMVAVWLPVLLFASLGAALIDRIRT